MAEDDVDTEKLSLNDAVARLVHRSPTMIPRFLHRIWLGSGDLPEHVKPWLPTTEIGFPQWEVKWWRDEDLELLAPHCICGDLLPRTELNVGLRSDILRYELLRLFGGAYVDIDVQFFKNLEEILLEGCLHLGLEQQGIVSNALIVSPSGSAFWEFFLRRIKARVDRAPVSSHEVLSWTGPPALADAVRMWSAEQWRSFRVKAEDGFPVGYLFDHSDLVIWDREILFPYGYWEGTWKDFDREKHPRCYAAHHWAGSWDGPSEKFAVAALS